MGASTVLFTFTIAMQFVYDGQLRHVLGSRFMHREIAELSGHDDRVRMGTGRRAVADDLRTAGHDVVIVDIDPERTEGVPYPTVVGDATPGLDAARGRPRATPAR